MLLMMTTLDIPQDDLESARLTAAEIKIELAVSLYASGRLSIGKARELADMSLWQFRQLLAGRQISPHFDEADLETDLETLQRLRRSDCCQQHLFPHKSGCNWPVSTPPVYVSTYLYSRWGVG
jgi:predicted HTH domain antitoxin